VTPGAVERLVSRGWAVLDGAIPPDVCRGIREDVEQLASAGAVHPNHTVVVRAAAGGGPAETAHVPKQGILESDMLAAQHRGRSNGVLSRIQGGAALRAAVGAGLPGAGGALDTQGVKAQVNEGGGGCFPVHLDSDRSVDGRLVTAIVYLNEGWGPGDGGALRLYPAGGGFAPVDVAPEGGRVVLFSSRSMPHRVLPAARRRVCFSAWLGRARDGRPPPPPPDLAAALAGDDRATLAFAAHPAVWKHACKGALAAEWERSIVESHPPGAGRDALVASHRRDVAVIEARLGPLLRRARELAAAGRGAELEGLVQWV